MRLISATSLQLSEFFGDDIPPYAILSHRWGREEVSFEQISFPFEVAQQMKGFKKIKYCVAQAILDGLDWCWVDTCCIDKRSSSELSEAINSMYEWYRRGDRCYAYLEDLTSTSHEDNFYSFSKSEWFSRGWTLQELIAPRHLVFYSTEWIYIGDKKSLWYDIAMRCQISKDILIGKAPVESASIAQRMQWASFRHTTRVEDIAYCLMGIFDVNMPLLYGEGIKAFARLQEEIIKRSTDQSIFAWRDPSNSQTTLRGLFARSPNEFKDCRTLRLLPEARIAPFTITNKGLHISLPLKATDDDDLEYLAILNCTASYLVSEKKLSVRLRRTHAGSDQFVRVDCNKWYWQDDQSDFESLFVPAKVPVFCTAGARTAGLKLSIDTINSRESGMWQQPECPREQGVIRFNSIKSANQGHHITRILFQGTDLKSWKILVILICNPQSCAITVATGLNKYSTSNDLTLNKTIQPYSCAAYIGKPTTYHNINDAPSEKDVQWNMPSTSQSFVSVGRAMVGDEMMFTADIQIQMPSLADSSKYQRFLSSTLPVQE